ncbi:MAG: hypothetical protein ACE37F_14140 [Nannocystaceae bacterium]|nr:hypothetical protein [bacterium]
MTRTGWIIGGVALAATGITAAVVLSGDSDAKQNRKKGTGVDTDPPGNATPEGGMDSDGVFRLEGAGLKNVACAARDAKSGNELARVLRGLREAVRVSGAPQVDLRNTGLVDDVTSAERFDAEIADGIAKVESLSGFLWPIVASKVRAKLSGLPACNASAQDWEAAAAGTSRQLALPAEAAPEPLWGVGRVLEEARSA